MSTSSVEAPTAGIRLSLSKATKTHTKRIYRNLLRKETSFMY